MRFAPLFALGCAVEPPTAPAHQDPSSPIGRVHVVAVGPDGAFDPQVVTIAAGDTVEWRLSDPGDSVIPVVDTELPPPGTCGTPIPHDPTSFTGPHGVAPGGVFALGPWGAGFAEVPSGRCAACASAVADDGTCLCATGPVGATLEATWADPGVAGVLIRLEWDALQTAPGVTDASFDWTVLDREVQQAVDHGKFYSLVVKAGRDGTPDWLFDAGVAPLSFRDGGSDEVGCGQVMALGSPADPAYGAHYNAMLAAVGAHLAARADVYRALAYLKPSGANLDSAENRLPKNCTPGCPVCNSAVWADAGYRPSGLYDFYAAQFAAVAEAFPDKAMGYALIGEGFPLVGEDGAYEGQDPSPTTLPKPGEQTETVVSLGEDTYGALFAVQENGLSVEPHSPNGRVIEAGEAGQVTGFQTTNAGGDRGVADPRALDDALENAWENTQAVFVEAYEERLYEMARAAALPSGKDLGEWTDDLRERRRADFPTLPDPAPPHYRFTFGAPWSGRTVHYVHGAKCAGTDGARGTIVVE